MVEEEYNIELDGGSLARDVQTQLKDSGVYSLPMLVARMGLSECMLHSEVLEYGVLRFSQDLYKYWGVRGVSVMLEYGVFVPAELSRFVTTKTRLFLG